MPHIFDNIEAPLLPALRATLQESYRADFCIGYFNLRGWEQLAASVDHLAGTPESCCRLLVGMHRVPEDAMREAQRAVRRDESLDGPTIARLHTKAARSFREQLEFGVPSARAQGALRKLAEQLRVHKVQVKLFLQYPLHAKLYLLHRHDRITPLVGYVGSSNLTLSGLLSQGELNVDVVEQDAAVKLQHWFDERWDDRLAFDISAELVELIETSWAADRLIQPYHVYLKMAYHLSEEARRGEREFKPTPEFRDVLLPFQEKAVSLAAYYLQRRGGVLLGDVVGLGKTLMATAVAKIFQQDDNSNTLIICPPKLQEMWEWYVGQYHLAARVLSLGRVIEDLPGLLRYRLVIIDESHNLRNREGKRYSAVRDYIVRNESQVLLLTATPYNKQYTDLSNQLRLFLDEDQDLHVRPEQFFQTWTERGRNEADFVADFQTSPRSIRAFEQSTFPDDWRDLMRLFLVRRTRQFIIRNYAQWDADRQRSFVLLNGQPSYFPLRQPKTVQFALDETDAGDQYARLYRDEVVDAIGDLALPRYNLAEFFIANPQRRANAQEKRIIDNLERAGRRLRGFSRSNLFKRLESSGYSFLRSLDHHILRNMITLHALEHNELVPIGTQNAALLDPFVRDVDDEEASEELAGSSENDTPTSIETPVFASDLDTYRDRAAQAYRAYRADFERRFTWLPAKFFQAQLKQTLRNDAEALLAILQEVGVWQPAYDVKMNALYELIVQTHPHDKLLIFTQFADTAHYLGELLAARGLTRFAVATGQSGDPTALARRFSPHSNGGLRPGETELRVLVATDVLGEGQNLQDSHVVVNFDLPWAIIRLIQRAGRVDRIGQKQDTINVYSFLPAEGIERIIRLRSRLTERLSHFHEVIGSDETFFGEDAALKLRDLYTEQQGVLDEDDDSDVDLASVALQVWNSASDADRGAAERLPPVIAAARSVSDGVVSGDGQPGVITYLRFPDGTDALVHVNAAGNLVGQSLSRAFRSAACGPDTVALPVPDQHYDLVAEAVQQAVQEQTTFGGELGSLRSTRRKVYEQLKLFIMQQQAHPTLFTGPLLERLNPAFELIRRYPLRETARDTLGRQMRLRIGDQPLAELMIRLHEEDRLSVIIDEVEQPEPQVVCSLGLVAPDPATLLS
ncbi:MAG: NgoFVII family restriction endonuclease [Herpetosiphonaceae bacterium]|nr:NgoFVII family restriction endonuclease [Herpetosiphonaceae bacterium]